MTSGIISLEPLYQFAREHADPEALNGMSAAGKEYGRLAAKLTGSIEAAQGFYLWGYYEPKGLWRNVYLGKAGFGKTAHLRSRILEELKDERCCLWRVALTEEEMLAAGARHYPSMWSSYEQNWNKSFRKTRATHITWVSDPTLSNADVGNIESDLIETLNPWGNISRPPPVSFTEHTHVVINQFRQNIHDTRVKRFRLELRPPIKAPSI